MSSESRDDRPVTVTVPGDLDDWLRDRAARLEVDRDELIVQLLAAYRTAAATDGEDPGEVDPAAALEAAVGDEFEERIAETAREEAAAVATETVADGIDGADGPTDDDLEERIVEAETEFDRKIEDLRERVIQVKRETDGKAPDGHDHEEIDRVAAELDELAATAERLDERVAGADDRIEALAEDLDAASEDREAALEGIRERLTDTEEKLRRVAWVVSDLRDEVGGRDAGREAVDRLKHAAAQEGVETATCGECGESVRVSLLTRPQCPHCETTVSDVRPDGGLFRTKARLVPAAQLEAGDDG